ncbi:hypothetical protein G7Z17_g4174 [Cylindrodendrum hubeiense]|uniref:Protein kinase domain-containing protein n=1 Tax=Cylindrodendrum hubeiense TaxID=595255 RepID=A0A9P5HB82_9HYPO|nr:hypothetical protein G7Z17_g4174 [Cylindrodendrum hubeiense]
MEVSSLAMAYEKTREERKRLRRSSHIIKWMSKRAENAKEVLTHPLRVRWVMVDKEAFEALLKDLHTLIERIHQLMGDYRGRRIHEITAKTYREMVLVRNDVNDLKNMFDAITGLIKTSKGNGDVKLVSSGENNETLRDLVRLKEINRISDTILGSIENDADFDIEKVLERLISVKQYDSTTFKDHFVDTEAEDAKVQSKLHRPRGVLTHDGTKLEVWIEWRTVENITKGSAQDKESKLRTVTLAQMLHIGKPNHLYSPNCIGYIDDYENSRYGWIFMMPDGSDKNTTVKSLHSILGQDRYKPTLAQRILLAWKLASSLLYLHTANWLHKGIHSGSVIFPFNGDIFDAENPILSGFEYSRPQSNKTTQRSLNPKWDIYRWPSIQNEAPKAWNSRKTYDIYGLGLVLLEIAHWKPLHKLMCLKRWPEPSTQDHRIRGWLLEEEYGPPFKNVNPLLELRNIAGDKYWKVVRRCLVAHGKTGMRIPEESDQSQSSEIGIELQESFTELVVEELKGVSV